MLAKFSKKVYVWCIYKSSLFTKSKSCSRFEIWLKIKNIISEVLFIGHLIKFTGLSFSVQGFRPRVPYKIRGSGLGSRRASYGSRVSGLRSHLWGLGSRVLGPTHMMGPGSCVSGPTFRICREFSSLVKRWSSISQQDLFLTEDIKSKLGSFDFTDDGDALELWTYLLKSFIGMLRNITWISTVCSTKTCCHKSLKELLLLLISCYLKLQTTFWYIMQSQAVDGSKNDCGNSDSSAMPEREIKNQNTYAEVWFQ